MKVQVQVWLVQIIRDVRSMFRASQQAFRVIRFGAVFVPMAFASVTAQNSPPNKLIIAAVVVAAVVAFIAAAALTVIGYASKKENFNVVGLWMGGVALLLIVLGVTFSFWLALKDYLYTEAGAAAELFNMPLELLTEVGSWFLSPPEENGASQ